MSDMTDPTPIRPKKTLEDIIQGLESVEMVDIGEAYEAIIPRNANLRTWTPMETLTTVARMIAYAVHTERQILKGVLIEINERLKKLEDVPREGDPDNLQEDT